MIKNNTTKNMDMKKNVNNISNNNEIRENRTNISKRKTNENKYKYQNIQSIKPYNIKELFDKNKLKLIPNINNIINDKIKEINYKLDEEDKKILNDNNHDKEKTIFFTQYMFFSKEKISIYSPHILKGKKNVAAILLSEEEKNLIYQIFNIQIIIKIEMIYFL